MYQREPFLKDFSFFEDVLPRKITIMKRHSLSFIYKIFVYIDRCKTPKIQNNKNEIPIANYKLEWVLVVNFCGCDFVYQICILQLQII